MEVATVADLEPISTEKITKKTPKKAGLRAKRLGLHQLSQKSFTPIILQDEPLQQLLGKISGGFDVVVFGESGSGKSNFVTLMIKELVKATNDRCDYISFEEGHEATMQETLIHRHDLLKELGNKMGVWDRIGYDELVKQMNKRNSPRIWVIDSIQTSDFTVHQTIELRDKFVLGRKRKIIIWVSWSDGRNAKGAIGKSVQYNAHIKLLVKGKIAFPISSRFGGKKNYIIWEEGAIKAWGRKLYNKHKSK